MATESLPNNVVPFVPGWQPAVKTRANTVDFAVFSIEQGSQDLSEVVMLTRTFDEALALRRLLAALVKQLNDVEQLAIVRIGQIVESERAS
jgi:hypothetical protein